MYLVIGKKGQPGSCIKQYITTVGPTEHHGGPEIVRFVECILQVYRMITMSFANPDKQVGFKTTLTELAYQLDMVPGSNSFKAVLKRAVQYKLIHLRVRDNDVTIEPWRIVDELLPEEAGIELHSIVHHMLLHTLKDIGGAAALSTYFKLLGALVLARKKSTLTDVDNAYVDSINPTYLLMLEDRYLSPHGIDGYLPYRLKIGGIHYG